MRLHRCKRDENNDRRHKRKIADAPRGLAMKALSMYDEQTKKEETLRRVVIIVLLSLIPLLIIAFVILLPFLNYDLSAMITWLFETDAVTILGYSLIIMLLTGVIVLLSIRIWRMRRSLSLDIKE